MKYEAFVGGCQDLLPRIGKERHPRLGHACADQSEQVGPGSEGQSCVLHELGAGKSPGQTILNALQINHTSFDSPKPRSSRHLHSLDQSFPKCEASRGCFWIA